MKWNKLPILELPKAIVSALEDSECFYPFCQYKGKPEFVLKRLLPGEVGICNGYRIISLEER
jgi:hypothetical protein